MDSLDRTRQQIRQFEAERKEVNPFLGDGCWLYPAVFGDLPDLYRLPTLNGWPSSSQYHPIFNVDAYRRLG